MFNIFNKIDEKDMVINLDKVDKDTYYYIKSRVKMYNFYLNEIKLLLRNLLIYFILALGMVFVIYYQTFVVVIYTPDYFVVMFVDIVLLIVVVSWIVITVNSINKIVAFLKKIKRDLEKFYSPK